MQDNCAYCGKSFYNRGNAAYCTSCYLNDKMSDGPTVTDKPQAITTLKDEAAEFIEILKRDDDISLSRNKAKHLLDFLDRYVEERVAKILDLDIETLNHMIDKHKQNQE